MKFIQFLSVAVIAAVITISSALASDMGSVSTQKFVRNAVIGSSFEIASSQLALEKSKNASIKEFAKKMINDHTAADKALKATIASEGLNPALAPATLDTKHQEMYDGLKTAKDFDAAYIKAQNDAHVEAVALFSEYSETGDNAAIKSFAQKTLPTLEQHLEHLKELK